MDKLPIDNCHTKKTQEKYLKFLAYFDGRTKDKVGMDSGKFESESMVDSLDLLKRFRFYWFTTYDIFQDADTLYCYHLLLHHVFDVYRSIIQNFITAK